MKSISATARILNDGNKPVVGVSFNLETYVLKTNRWLRVGTAKTDAKGNWSLNAKRSAPNEIYAPILRLIEVGRPSPRVLAQHCYLQYDATKQILTADFGVVERLDKETFKLTAVNSLFKRSNYYIAGEAQAPAEVKLAVARRISATDIGRTESLRVASTTTTNSPVKANEAELVRLRSSETELKSAVVAKEELISAKELELAKARTSETELKRTLTTKERLISSKESELSEAKLQITDLSKTLQDRLKEIERLRKAKETTSTGEAKAVPLSTIATNIGSEVDSANKNLQSRNLPYTFGKIDLSLRGAVEEDGQSIAMARIKDAASAKGLSNINLELLPTKGQADLRDAVKVPDISGLTETVVRRLLSSVGLRLEVVSKSVGDNSKIAIGQSMQQSPKAGAAASRNDTVLVVFAAP